MSDQKPHIIPELDQWPITQFSLDKEAFIQRLIEYTFNRITVQQGLNVEEVLDRTVFLENKRTAKGRWKVDPVDEKNFWKKIRKEIRDAGLSETKDDDLKSILKRIIHRYAVELVGSFHPKTFKFARKFLKVFFKRLYNKRSFFKIKNRYGSFEELTSRMEVTGYVQELRELFKKGTVVVVPTHFTNLDSIQIGYAIDTLVGVPAFIYGAGLNLYNNELIAYYMNRLGTYRVDRRKKNRVYIETLKCMNTLSLIEGLNNLFFPGGTRSRSGATESSLKLGLLNSVVESQRYCIQQNIDQKIFIFPLITSYPSVLDAGALIHDYLRGFGKEKYNTARKQYSFFKIFFSYLRKTRNRSNYVVMNFGKPMDVFGNDLTEEGDSIDKNGNKVKISEYFKGLEGYDTKVQREYVYTKKLANRLLHSFKTERIVLATSIVAFVAFRSILKNEKEEDIFNLLRMPAKMVKIPLKGLVQNCEMLLSKLQDMEMHGDLILHKDLTDDVNQIIEEGIKHLGVYHIESPLKFINKQTLGTESLNLLFYYHNQLSGYEIESWFDEHYISNHLVNQE